MKQYSIESITTYLDMTKTCSAEWKGRQVRVIPDETKGGWIVEGDMVYILPSNRLRLRDLSHQSSSGIFQGLACARIGVNGRSTIIHLK